MYSEELKNNLIKILNDPDFNGISDWASVYSYIKNPNDFGIAMICEIPDGKSSYIYRVLLYHIPSNKIMYSIKIYRVESFCPKNKTEIFEEILDSISKEHISKQEEYFKLSVTSGRWDYGYDDPATLYIPKNLKFLNKISFDITSDKFYLIKIPPISDVTEFLFKMDDIDTTLDIIMSIFPNRRALVGALDYKENLEKRISRSQEIIDDLKESIELEENIKNNLLALYNDETIDNYIKKYFGETAVASRRLLKEI